MRAYKLTGCRAGNDELEDAECHENLGTSQLLEDATKAEVPLHKIVKTSRRRIVHCPKDKTCELECKGSVLNFVWTPL